MTRDGRHGRPGELPASVPVLIAGGGPVGLAAAIELDLHGIASVVIERREEVSWLRPRAKTTSARTMEHFRRWGLADDLRAAAYLPASWSDEAVFCTQLLGREITRFERCFGLDLIGSDLVAECGQQVPQPVVEQVLRDAIASSRSAELFTGMKVVSLREDHDGVEVEIVDDRGKCIRVVAEYVVGCEGARSVVRDAIGARYEGTEAVRPNFNIVFRAPGLGERVPHGPAVHYWVLNPDQPGLVGRMDLGDTWWCIAQGVDAELGESDPARLVHELVGAEMAVSVLATDAWQARMLLVDRYGGRRMFLAGDAAHQNPPWGGHGFNTGIGDAVNVAWKLAAVLGGWAPSTLLASYERERRPVAARTIEEAARNMATLAPELADPRLMGSDVEFETARPAVAAAVQATKDREFHSLGLTLGYDYEGSPIIATEAGSVPHPGTTPSAGYEPTAAPGHRLPHRWLGPGDSLYDRIGTGLTLVGDLSLPAAGRLMGAARAGGVPLSGVDLPGGEWSDVFGAPLVLVRPDQHVAWRGDGTDDPDATIGHAIGLDHGTEPRRAADLERTR